ncbi:MAG: ferredoxin [Halioglobus sp.]|nr:ferredoxin [Halioglobus sp.]
MKEPRRFCIKADMQLCQGHGECAEEAPELFEVDYATDIYPKVKILTAQPEAALREKAEAAARYCPNRVLTVLDLED